MKAIKKPISILTLAGCFLLASGVSQRAEAGGLVDKVFSFFGVEEVAPVTEEKQVPSGTALTPDQPVAIGTMGPYEALLSPNKQNPDRAIITLDSSAVEAPEKKFEVPAGLTYRLMGGAIVGLNSSNQLVLSIEPTDDQPRYYMLPPAGSGAVEVQDFSRPAGLGERNPVAN